jgi:hypothetical protein
MDKLTEKQRADIQKMSTTRLINKLTGVGMEELEIDALDRNGLMNAWAKFVLAGKDKPVPVAPVAMPTLDPAYSKQLLELEVRKFEAEEKRREIEYQERLKVLEVEERNEEKRGFAVGRNEEKRGFAVGRKEETGLIRFREREITFATVGNREQTHPSA